MQDSEQDLHRALGFCSLAILGATKAAFDRFSPEQRESFSARVKEGGRLVLVVAQTGLSVHVELALAEDGPSEFFDAALLRLDGPMMLAATPPDDVEVTDRMALN